MADIEGREEDKKKYEGIVSSIDEYFIAMRPPQDFSAKSANNAVNQIDLSFSKLCASLEDAGVQNPRDLSVYDFNVRLDFYYDKNKKR